MARFQILLLTSVAMVAFAGNSLLCRFALAQSGLDPASFTTIRLVAGALMLGIIVAIGRRSSAPDGLRSSGSWLSGFALFAYAARFSFAYVSLTAATGALVLFGAVQISMVGYAISQGGRLGAVKIAGLLLALAGLTCLLWPGLSAPPPVASLLMLIAGLAWGVYTLRGRGAKDPLRTTAVNFLMSIPFTLVLSVVMVNKVHVSETGIWFAIASGALTSGVGYAIWYWVLPFLKATNASIVQLSVPVIAVFGGAVLLKEPVTLRLFITSIVILGGIALVTVEAKTVGDDRRE